MKENRKAKYKNTQKENYSPVCYLNSPEIQANYLLPELKSEHLKSRTKVSRKQKNKEKPQ
ncbi:hypothetical protein CA2015_4541 [Cyclobacterium amurskyense]|jgi:hypothetical protein|uniref:Uncharacterized protein n=1 Tax=Cyclobacterium amurskyense TaxID=320787 RepID=A0A0H4PIA8_9BACT|nr:hypothetical protein CA2015_4541 [Cyclobacterium amurskyense]|tara:strand:+ start:1732 stop:1911 length:180 start_codon:yes stop_codon:yes gene_type:complete